jgi:small subunit ribosomal protein S6
MNNYEAMFIVKPDLNEEAKKDLFSKIRDTIEKNNGKVISADLWSEKRKLYFPIKKCREGIYYLVNFHLEPKIITNLSHEYKLNENILRVLITNLEQK